MAGEKFVKYKDGKYITDDSGGGGGSSTFAGLDDVSFSNLSNGQVPKYNSSTQKWENGEPGGGGTVTDVKVNGTSVVDGNHEAQIKSYKEVTQAQYEALPSSKLTDNILYAIKDVGGADSMPPIIYSDEEREVGVWRDGKPLYQKTIVSTYSFHQTGVHSIAIDIHDLDIDTPVSINGFWRRWAGDGNKLWYQYGSEESTYGIGWARIDSENSYTNGRLAIEIRSDGTDLQIVTLQYTKNTDTPGSGIWNQQGCYAHHYSTTEKVIGTWIDGKPVYEKTVNFGALPNMDSKGVNHGISNLDTIIGYDGVTKNQTGSTFLSLPRTANDSQYDMDIYFTTTQIIIVTKTDRSAHSTYITMSYTKTTD